ncbi:MAG: hypothetical protein ACLTKG_04600 [Collinsella intestinalis]
MAGVQIIRIETLDDPRLEAYTKLTERQLRSVLEPEKGIFIAESGKVIERAVEAGLEPVSFLLGERWLEQLSPLLDKGADAHPELKIPVFVGAMDLLEQLTGFSVTRTLAALVDRHLPIRAFLDGLVERADARPVRVARGHCRSFNVGAIFRPPPSMSRHW